MGPVSNASACSPSSPSAVAASTVSNARAAGSSDNAPLTAGAATGTPAAAKARGNRAPARGTDRTMTAICDQGTPSIRCARRSASAIIAASACADAARRTLTDPSSAPVPSICLPLLPPGSRPAMPLTARATAGAQRCDTVNVTDGVVSGTPAGRQPGRLAAPETEHRLVGVAGHQRQFGARRKHPDQARRLRVELLRVVDQQEPDPAAFGCQQLRIDCESFQSGTHKFGGTQRRGRRLWRRRSDRRPQQHHLLVLPRELTGSGPFGTPAPTAQPLQLLRVHTAFGAAGQQASQFGGETRGAQGGPEVGRPCGQCVRPVFEIAGQQFPDNGVLFGAGDEPRGRIAGTLGGPPQDRVCVAVHGPHQRLPNRGPARHGGARSEQRHRQGTARPHPDPTGTGKQQNRFRIDFGVDLSDRGVDQQAALTRAGPAQDTHQPAHAGCQQSTRLAVPGV